MIKRLQFNGDSCYLYLSKPILQLLRANPKEAYFLFTIKNKNLYVTKINNENQEEYKDALIKKVQKNGTGFCMYIPKPILEIIDINPELDTVDISIEEETLIIKKS